MKRLILTSYRDRRNNKRYKELFTNDYQFRSTFDTFNDLSFEDVEILNFQIKGRNYKEKQNCLRDLAISFQEMISESCDIDITITEIATICEWLETRALDYGLVKEFKENAII